MTQPQEFAPGQKDPLDVPLKNSEQLIRLFHDAERKKSDWLLGIEYEMFGQINEGLTPIPYEGETSISRLFKFLAQRTKDSSDPFLPIFEGENVVALTCQRAVIALEPGGQIEIATKPAKGLLDTTSRFTDVAKEIRDKASEIGINLFAMGLHPLAHQEDMAMVKKARYAIMRSYMQKLNGLGLDMMTRSCSIQINLDYQDEKDMVQKARLGACLAPFYSVLTANSALLEGKPASHAIARGNVWRNTDPDRTGIPSIIFDENFGYAAWIEMVLDVPMYFIRRDHTYYDVAGSSFRRFIKQGHLGLNASVRDFVDHMSTVFTEVRLKPILELRSADSLPICFANGLIALTWALFYHDRSHKMVVKTFDGMTHAELISLRNEAIDLGKDAKFRNREILEILKELLFIAKDALLDLAKVSSQNELPKLVDPLISLVERNITCAEWTKKHFKKVDRQNLKLLVEAFEPFNNPLA